MNLTYELIDGVPTIKNRQIKTPSNLLLIDVRSPDEFIGELGHIQGAQLKTLGPELEQFLTQEDKNKEIIFICRSGVRSARATTMALTLGFQHVYNLEGGMLAWNQAGLKTEKN